MENITLRQAGVSRRDEGVGKNDERTAFLVKNIEMLNVEL
jgi:hypothetical protein